MEQALFEEEISSQVRKYKRKIRRARNVEERETHAKRVPRNNYSDIDEQYEAYLRTGNYDFDEASF